jgi:hypothetical protein
MECMNSFMNVRTLRQNRMRIARNFFLGRCTRVSVWVRRTTCTKGQSTLPFGTIGPRVRDC